MAVLCTGFNADSNSDATMLLTLLGLGLLTTVATVGGGGYIDESANAERPKTLTADASRRKRTFSYA
eukprot:4829268-Prymnesium_polylepis.1